MSGVVREQFDRYLQNAFVSFISGDGSAENSKGDGGKEGRVAEAMKSVRSAQTLAEQGYSAADTAANEVFQWEEEALGEPLSKKVEVGVTGGTREMTETTAGEIHTTGTQLLPVGKAAKKNIRSFLWVQGEDAPVMSNLTDDEKNAILQIIEGKQRLPVENHIPYVSSVESREIREELADLRARGLVSSKTKEASHDRAVERVADEDRAGKRVDGEDRAEKREDEEERAAKRGNGEDRAEKRGEDAKGPTEEAAVAEVNTEEAVFKRVKEVHELWPVSEVPMWLGMCIEAAKVQTDGWSHVRVDFTLAKGLRMRSPLGIHDKVSGLQRKLEEWTGERKTCLLRESGKRFWTHTDSFRRKEDRNRPIELEYEERGWIVQLTFCSLVKKKFEDEGEDGVREEKPPTEQLGEPELFDIGETIAGSEGRSVQELFNAFVAERLLSAHVAQSTMSEFAQECKRVALELAKDGEDGVCDCCGCRWDAPPERDKTACGAQKKEKEKKKSTSKSTHPFRILPAADWVDHDHKDGVHDETSAGCGWCQFANMRSRSRKKRIRVAILGEFAVDLISRITETGAVQFILVLASMGLKENEKKRKICVVLPMINKTFETIYRQLLRGILLAEYLWKSTTVKRIHADREAGLMPAAPLLHEGGILLTSTEGAASQDNPYAEEAIAKVSRGARVAVVQACKNGVTSEFRTFLYPYAAQWAGGLWSAKSAQDAGVDVRLKVADFIPFASYVLFRRGPGKKLDKEDAAAEEGYFLHPSWETPGGSVVLTKAKPHRILTVTTVRPVLDNGELSFPGPEMEVPRELRGRPKKVKPTEGAVPEPKEAKPAEPAVPKRGPGRPRKSQVNGSLGSNSASRDSHARGYESKHLQETEGESSYAGRARSDAKVGLLAEMFDSTGGAAEAFVSRMLASEMTSEETVNADERGDYTIHDEPMEFDVDWTVEDVDGNQVAFEAMVSEKWDALEGVEEGPPEAFCAVRVMRDVQARVTKVIPWKEAKLRPGFSTAVKNEVGRMLQFHAYGKPVPRSRVPKDGRIYRGKGVYAVKHWETVNEQADKCRLVVQGNIRILPNGKIHLDRWHRKKGEFWAPVGSLAGLRLVVCMSAVQSLDLQSIDLDSGYLQTRNQEIGKIFLDLDSEFQGMMADDWQAAIEAAKRLDEKERGLKYGEGQCVFPVEGNMYGEAGAGQGFIVVFQNALIRCGWTRAKEDPSFFFRLCPKSKKLQGISSYVDDLAGAISSKDPKKIWDELRARGWIFENEKELTKFLGVVIKKNSPRWYELSQEDYVTHLVQVHEERRGVVLRARVTMPEVAPEHAKGPLECGTDIRSDIGALMYASRGTRPDLTLATSTLASASTKWWAAWDDFLGQVLACVKGTKNRKLQINATGWSEHLDDWGISAWVDSGRRKDDRCQTGVLVCVAPLEGSAQGGKPPPTEGLLPWQWQSTAQAFYKVSIMEGEYLALLHGGRAGLTCVAMWRAMIAVLREYGESGLDEDVDEQILRLFEDNAATIVAVQRGIGASAAPYFALAYRLAANWVHERYVEGQLNVEKEATLRMLADGLTKLVSAACKSMFERGLLSA